MLLKGVLIGLELRKFDKNVRLAFGIPALTKSSFGKKTELRGFHSRPTICQICKISGFYYQLGFEPTFNNIVTVHRNLSYSIKSHCTPVPKYAKCIPHKYNLIVL